MSDDRAPLRKAGDDHLHPSALRAEESTVHLGGTTSDALSAAGSDKPVKLEARIPKSLRKSLRKEAERRGVSVDQVVTEALLSRTIRQ